MHIKNFIKKNKTHFLFIALILLLVIIRLPQYLDSSSMPYVRDPSEQISGTDLTNNNAVNANILRNSIFEYNDFIPLWNPYYLAGTPFYPKAQKPVFAPLTLFLLILPSAWMAIKWDIILHLFIAGLATYLLVNQLKLKPIYAFISAIIYMFNYLILEELFVGHTNILFAYAYLPFIFFFTLKAIENKSVPYAIITGIFFAMQFHAEGPQPTLYSLLLFFCFLLLQTVTRYSKKRVQKIAIIAIISMLVFAGLAAIKLLPASEALQYGARQEGFSYERSTRGQLTIENFFPNIIKQGIGFVPAILFLFSIPYFKKKNVMIFLGLFLFAILILSGSFLYKLIWLYIPFFDKIKDLNKGFMLIMFIGSVLSAYGAKFIVEKIKKKETYIAISIIILLLLNLWIFAPKKPTMIDINEWQDNNEIMNYMADDNSLFRFHNYESNGIDHGVGHFSVPLDLENIYGYDAALWHLQYLPIYLSIYNQFPAKFGGILNVKYVTSITPLDVPGFELVKEFKRCEICRPLKSAGPYLYENKQFLPRAYFVSNSILLVGRNDVVIEGMYILMTDSDFRPYNTVITGGKEKIDEYDIEFLEKFDVIFLLEGSATQKSLPLLKKYLESGGQLFPNIIENEKEISKTKLKSMWDSFDQDIIFIKDSDIIRKNYDEIEINLNKKNGFLVLSEKFALFPGWTAKIDNKKADILKADGVISSIYIPENSEKIVFEYKPKTYIVGRNITAITLLIVILVLLAYSYKKYKKINK